MDEFEPEIYSKYRALEAENDELKRRLKNYKPVLPKHIIIDKYPQDNSGKVWYHLGNMYWCPEYSTFGKWMSENTNKDTVKIEYDFPHADWYFTNPATEVLFLKTWKEFIQEGG